MVLVLSTDFKVVKYELVLIVSGDRNWTDREKIRKVLTEFNPQTTLLVEGGARGADRLARQEGRKLGFKVITVDADWHKYGKAAGAVRNRVMYNTYKPHGILAFHSNISESKGTKDMIEVAEKGGTPVRLTT